MPKRGQSRKEAMKELRSEDMKERIRTSNLLTDALDTIVKMNDLATAITEDNHQLTSASIQALEKTNNQRKWLLDKVMATPKEIDATVKGIELSYDEWIDEIRSK